MTSYNIPTDKILYAHLDEQEGVLLHLDTKRYFRLNETAQVIWQALENNDNQAQVVQKLCATFDIDSETAAHDLDQFLEKLHHEQFIKLDKPVVSSTDLCTLISGEQNHTKP